MRLWPIIIGGALTAAGLTALVAQTVDGLDLDAVRRRGSAMESDAQALADQVKDRGAEFREDALSLQASGTENMKRLSSTDLPKGPNGPVDFDEIVKGASTNATQPAGDAPQFIVFASLSMPAKSLKPLIADTARAGGVVVFRGFPNNSAKLFATTLAKAVDQSDLPHVGIDPRLFRAFNVEAVPTFVAVSSNFDLCSGFSCQTRLPPYDRMAGNVSVDYALTAFADGNGPGAKIASVALANMTRGHQP